MTTRLSKHVRGVRAQIERAVMLAMFFLAVLSSHAAIKFVGASRTACVQSSSSTGTQTCTLTAPTTAGNDIVAAIAWKNTSATITSVAGSAPGTWFFPYSSVCNSLNECTAILICHQCTSQTAVTTTMSAGTPFATTVDEYSGVRTIGATGTLTGNSGSPGFSSPAHHPDDWTVCTTASLGSSGAPFPGSGTLRIAVLTGTSSGDIVGAMVDNTASTSSSLACTEATAAGPWAAAGVELSAAASPTYIWPDCDTSHPCVVHHIDTVGDGTAYGETLQDFKFPMVPSSPGNLLIFTVMHVSSKSITVTDNNNGNWQTAVTTTNAADGQESELLYICGATAGTNLITIHLSQPAVHDEPLHFTYDEVSGVAPTACLDGAAAANGLKGTVQPGPVTTTVDGDMIFNYGEETYQYPEYDSPIGAVTTDSNAALLMENIVDKYASEVSVQAAYGAYTPTLYVNADPTPRNWNSVAAAFIPSLGAGTQPTGVHITRILHFVGVLVNPVTVPFPSSGNAIVISTSNPIPPDGIWPTSPTTRATPIPVSPFRTPRRTRKSSPPASAPDPATRISSSPGRQAINNHVLFYDIAGAATTMGARQDVWEPPSIP